MSSYLEKTQIYPIISQQQKDSLDLSFIEALGFGVTIIDANTHEIVYINQKVSSMSGYAMEDVYGRTCHNLLCPARHGKCPITDLGQRLEGSERILIHKDGKQIPVRKTVVPFKLGDKDYLIESLIDDSERKTIYRQLDEANRKLQAEMFKCGIIQERIEHLAYHDYLTDLPNRLLFGEMLDNAMSMSKRMGKMLAVMFLDLDGFKMINDTLGHYAGDTLLQTVSQRLVSQLRVSDIIARIGGDEFIVMIENLRDLEVLYTVAEKVLRCFDEPFWLEKQECYLTTSIGIAVYPTDGEDAETLIKNADIAMYKAKEKGKNQYAICTSLMKQTVLQNMRLSNHLYRAVEREELEVYYQPQVNAESSAIIGLEALLRWHHPLEGMVSPGIFIPIAEQTGQIIHIGEWVLRAACSQNKAWQDAGLPKLRIAVNISVRQIQSTNLVRTVEKILNETGLEAKYLELEITESAIMNESNAVIETLSALKEMGVKIAIDDFGTEYSSLNYIRKLPIDRIKIAMPFVQGISISNEDEAIVKAIIVLAKSLELDIIAEGVETSGQLDFLSQRMCEEIQGFFFYKPMPANQIEELLRKMTLLNTA